MEAAARPDFGTLLRQLRLGAALTQQELAERAKLSVEAISQLERGARTRPHPETIASLASALNLAPERQALLTSAIRTAHRPRPRESAEASNSALLRLVRPDTQSSSSHNLPQPLTSFVGRQQEVSQIAALLRDYRLLTVVGAGGVGKTRVAIQVAGDLLADYPDGVWLVDLAPLAQDVLVDNAILTALQLPCATVSALDGVIAYLKSRPVLLILDNCEHVVVGAREIASKILASCPSAHILATSRQALQVCGERVYRLPSLAIPPKTCRDAQSAASYEAVALLIDRAVAVNASFALRDDNAADVGELCRRLDGIPLAIELAAARVQVLAPHQITRHLDQRFRLLTGEPGALSRHQTMTALIDWSYDILTPREQRLFEALSVFAGGCTLESATAACAADGEDELDMIDLMTSLVTKSLLVAELDRNDPRYFLPESSRQYAKDKLIARGEREQMERRHALAYVDLAARLERASNTMPDREWLPQVQVELENWRAALEWALGKQSGVIHGQHLAASRAVLFNSFPLPEARRWVRAAVALVDERTCVHLVGRLEHADAQGAANATETKASLMHCERALARYREVGDIRETAEAQRLAAHALMVLGKFAEGEALLHEALRAARSLRDGRLTAFVLRTMGITKSLLHDFSGARTYFIEAMSLANLSGAESLAASTTAACAENEADSGDTETALRLMTEALAAYRAINYPQAQNISTTIGSIAQYLIALGRYDEAQLHANDALKLAQAAGMGTMVFVSLLYLVLAAALRPAANGRRAFENFTGAAHIFGFVAARLAESGIPEVYFLPHERDRALTAVCNAIGITELTRLMAVGATMTEDEAIALALAFE